VGSICSSSGWWPTSKFGNLSWSKIYECAQYWGLNWLWDWLEMSNIHGIK